MSDKKTLKVKLVRSPIGCKQSHRVLEDTPAVRGMINKIAYLVLVL